MLAFVNIKLHLHIALYVKGPFFALMITRYTSHIFLEFCPCFYRFCEFTRTPKNCIIEGNETVFPCVQVQPCESDSNNCQAGEVFVSTVQINSWVSSFSFCQLQWAKRHYLMVPPFIVKHCLSQTSFLHLFQEIQATELRKSKIYIQVYVVWMKFFLARSMRYYARGKPVSSCLGAVRFRMAIFPSSPCHRGRRCQKRQWWPS